MGDETPERQLSPDRKYYWDGQRWVPVEQPSLPQPAQQPITAQAVPATRPTNSLAVASLVFGIVSWVMCPFVGGLVAIITGHMAHGQIKRTGEQGGGMATAGLILGYIHLVAVVFVVFIAIVAFGAFAAFLAAMGVGSPTPSP